MRAIVAYAYAFKGSKALALAEVHENRAPARWEGMVAHSPVLIGPEGRKDTLVFLEDLRTKARKQYVDPVWLASQYAQLGDKEQALTWLKKGYEVRSNDMVHLKISPFLDPLRSDPRFQDLLRRMNFPN